MLAATEERTGLQRLVHTGSAIPDSTSAALELIRSQPSRYVIATLGGRRHILAPRDLLTIPRMGDVKVGDVVALSAIHELGSREYTLRGNPTIPPSIGVRVRATVVEHTKGAMEFIFKKKRRKGYQKLIQHKQPYTRLRIGDIEVEPPKQRNTAVTSGNDSDVHSWL
ncbi:ribosomal protein L21-like protein [Mycena sp. CBHHK59/15]|nr:ribosomal protein L21-like protein [Mycena sp. CBHHK59/15]